MNQTSQESLIVAPGPRNGVFRLPDGSDRTAPKGWALLPPGDAGVTRRVKASGPSWTIQKKRGRKVFSQGVLAPKANIDEAVGYFESKRSTEAYRKQQASAARRRHEKEAEYAQDFHGEVVRFLDFHPRYAEIAHEIARKVADHATPVGSGTVARTKRLTLGKKAEAAVIAWMRHQTTDYDNRRIGRGQRRDVRRMLAERSRDLLENYRRGEPIGKHCPLSRALEGS